jgi:predicted transposase YdaD
LVTKPDRSPLYNSIEDILANYRAKLEQSRSLTPEEEELIMNLSVAYTKRIQEAKLEGKLETIMALLQAGAEPAFIANALGLPIESIEKLRTGQKPTEDDRI